MVIFSALWFSILSAFWSRSTVPARSKADVISTVPGGLGSLLCYKQYFITLSDQKLFAVRTVLQLENNCKCTRTTLVIKTRLQILISIWCCLYTFFIRYACIFWNELSSLLNQVLLWPPKIQHDQKTFFDATPWGRDSGNLKCTSHYLQVYSSIVIT